MKLIARVLLLLTACGALALSGFHVSQLRAAEPSSLEGVVAAAGGETAGFLGSGSLGLGDDRYRLSSLSVFSNVALHVKDHYVDPERVDPKEMLVRALEEIEKQIAEVLVETEGDEIHVEVMEQRKTVLNDVENLWEINLKLREVFRFFEKHLPPQDDVRLIEYAAVNGALSTLDPHSILLKPEAFAEMKTSTKGEFGGLGIVISIRDNKLTIISPIDGTPASRAGLLAGDVISRIGDVSTVSMPVDEAVRMLRGPKGSAVTIWIDRKSWSEARKFSIVRERIKLESVESKLLSSNVGYVKIKNFQQNTGKDLETHLEKLRKKAKGKLRGLVMDLRNNPGGLLEQATRVSDKFVSSGDIVTTVGYGNKLREPKRARWSGTETKLPVAILVNRGSASASEIVAGALKNLDRATIIGETSFGKGSVQVLYDFSDNSALKLTIAQYLTPGDISIQNEGVQPDISLEPAWISEEGVRIFYRDDSHREASLDKHLERAGRPKAHTAAPRYNFTYLVREREEDEDAPPDPLPTDFQVDFARDYLLSAGSPSRSQSLSRAEKFLAKTTAEEEQRAVAKLGELGVDWSKPGPGSAGAALLDVSLELVDPVAPGTVTSGSAVKLRATVTNRGKQAIHRLHGTVRSDNTAFEGREMMFGKLEPGASKSWTVKTRVPREESSRVDRVRLELQAGEQEIAQRASLDVTTQLVAQPQFAFTWLFDDTERGDGDGILEVGEGVDFEVLVKNIGLGEAKQVTLRLKSAAQEDLFLERGRTKIGAIAPGATARGTLRFRVPEQQSDRGVLPLELAVYDAQSGEWLESQIDLKAHPAKKTASKKATGARQTSRDTTLLRGALADAPVVAVAPKGARLELDAVVGEFARIRFEGARGFVRRSALEKAGPTKKEAIEIALQPAKRPPRIVLPEDLGGRVLAGGRLRLEGEVSGRVLRDMYVLLNDDKVYFERWAKPAPPSGRSTEALVEGWQAPDDEAAKMPFDINLELEEGLNEVVVVARLDEKVVSHRTIYVARAGGPAVAERVSTEEKPAATATE